VARDYLAHSTATVLAQSNPLSTLVTIMLKIEIDQGNNAADLGQITIDSFDLHLD
jgi:hypothetical protein